MTFRPDTLVANRYLLVKKVGAGGMGSVWAAHDQALDAPCAVKLVNENLVSNEEVRARFAREAKLAAQLRSPHVVHVFDCGEANGTLYIVMEWLDGESLATRLEREGRLDAGATYRVVAHIARALTTAHGLGIVHRDLKPDNVFLVPGYDEEIAKVLDFGIAYDSVYAQRDHLTIPGSLLGTPVYLSPEQARGRPVDHRADLWSLGVIVFECLTGSSPFDAPAIGEVMGRILYEPLPMPTELNEELPSEIDDWWQRAAARNRDKRFQSAKEFVDALGAALSVQRSLSVPPPGRSRASSIPGLTRSSGIQLPKAGDRGSEPPAARSGEGPAAPGPSRNEATTLPAQDRADVDDSASATAAAAEDHPEKGKSASSRTKLLWPSETPVDDGPGKGQKSASSRTELPWPSASPEAAEPDESDSESDSSTQAEPEAFKSVPLSPAEAELDESVRNDSVPPEGDERADSDLASQFGEAEAPSFFEVPPAVTGDAGSAVHASLRSRLPLLLVGLTILMFMAGFVLFLVVRSTTPEPAAASPPAETTAVESAPSEKSESEEPPAPDEPNVDPNSDVPVIRLENLPKATEPDSAPTAKPRTPVRRIPQTPAPAASVRDYGI